MKKEEKKGMFGRIFGNKEKKSSCCNLEIEEIPEENNKEKDEPENKNNSCCG